MKCPALALFVALLALVPVAASSAVSVLDVPGAQFAMDPSAGVALPEAVSLQYRVASAFVYPHTASVFHPLVVWLRFPNPGERPSSISKKLASTALLFIGVFVSLAAANLFVFLFVSEWSYAIYSGMMLGNALFAASYLHESAWAWLLHKGKDVVPIPGTKRRKYLEENAGAASIRFDDKQVGELDASLAPDKVSGPRYNERQMAMVDR